MATVRRRSGVSVTVSDALTVTDLGDAIALRGERGERRDARVAATQASTPATEQAALLAAMRAGGIDVLDQFGLTPAPASHSSGTPSVTRAAIAGAPAGGDRVEIGVDLSPAEDAVILLEQDGVYSWHFGGGDSAATTSSAMATHRAGPARRRRVTFMLDIALAARPTAPAGSAALRHGLIGDWIHKVANGIAKAFVLKFDGRLAIDGAIHVLERHVQPGLIVMRGADPGAWARVENIAAVPLPDERAPRILLFIHGTFSSTVGGFGALGATPWGREFLSAAERSYDAVIGYDHATLSIDPAANAADLIARFGDFAAGVAPLVDVVMHSRGGLVFRALTEQLLPVASHRPTIGTAIFVGVPNAGTSLAEPDNWKTLLDLYTNLAVASFRVIEAFPQAAATALILEEVVKGVGALLQFIATRAISRDGVPGLAAMEPAGKFITTLNQTQPGQPTADLADYRAIVADFEPSAVGASGGPSEISPSLMLRFADGFIDRLMRGDANDLVVNTPSMERIDPDGGRFIKDALDFGRTPHVYHTIYFTRPEVTTSLARWLSLVADPPLAARSAGVGRTAKTDDVPSMEALVALARRLEAGD